MEAEATLAASDPRRIELELLAGYVTLDMVRGTSPRIPERRSNAVVAICLRTSHKVHKLS
jgi:hypothetical protein